MIKKLIEAAKNHKLTTLLIIIALGTVGYFIYQMVSQESSEISYKVQTVQKGDIEDIVSATGQLQDTDQIDINPDITGEVTAINVEVGSKVKKGDVLFTVDSSDLEESIKQAQLDLETAQIKLNQMKEPDETTIFKAENELESAQDDLLKLKLQQEQEMDKAVDNKESAEEALEDMDEDDPQYNSTLSQLADAERQIESYELSYPIAIKEAEAKIKEREIALADAKEGISSDELRLQEITVSDKQSMLNELTNERADYTVTTPRDGLIVTINIEVGDDISGGGGISQTGNSTLSVPMTIISNIMEAVVVINEVDILDIQKDQQARLTFDAIDDLEITGKVSEIDLIGTEDQGVVTHNVTISLDTQDERFRSGMSTSVDIITAAKKDVVRVPVGAVTVQGEREIVQTVDRNVEIPRSGEVSGITTRMTSVTTGISDDVYYEITEGLEAGDVIVTDMVEDSDEEEDSSNTNRDQGPGGGMMPIGGKAIMR